MTRDQRLSFAVGSKHGRRSAKWIVTATDEDLYVAYAPLRTEIKATLHLASGVWQCSQLPGAKLRDPARSRHMVRTNAANTPLGLPAIGVTIVIPEECLRPASDVDVASVPEHWLPLPPYGGITVVSVYVGEDPKPPEQYPGQAVGTEILGRLDLPIGRSAWVVYMQLAEIPVEISKSLSTVPRTARPILDSPERRGVMVSLLDNNAIRMLEHAID